MFIIVVIDYNINYTFWDMIYPYFNPSGIVAVIPDLPQILFLAVRFLVYLAGAIVFYMLISRDLKEESERRLKEQNLLYAAIAHDLKTPMTSVSGFAKALSEGRIEPSEQQEVYDIIYNKTGSMNEMVNTLFEYSKLGTDQYTPKPVPFDLCVLLRSIAAEYYTEFESHNIELEVDIPEEPIMIKGVENDLKRAFSNLIVNVYKHNPEGVRAKISASCSGEKVLVRVMDSGEPIPAGHNIFEPFITNNDMRTTGKGSGLGLAITKRVVENHGGKVYVENGDAGYTKAFVVRL